VTVPENLAALPPFLIRAILAGLPHVRIILGISGERLRVAVRDCHSGIPAVSCAVRDDRNPGVTIACFYVASRRIDPATRALVRRRV
jgi:hypothetical protein